MAESDILKFDRRPNHVVLTLNLPKNATPLTAQCSRHSTAPSRRSRPTRASALSCCAAKARLFPRAIDLRELEQVEASGPSAGVTAQDVFRRLESLPIPTIAAVQGATLTGGLVLALLCDLRVAAENAGTGMTPGANRPGTGLLRLPQIHGASRSGAYSGNHVHGRAAQRQARV